MPMVGGTEIATPECERLAAVTDQSQAIGEFLEWLSEQGVRRMKWGMVSDVRVCPELGCSEGKKWRGIGKSREEYDCSRCEGTGSVDVEYEAWVSDSRSISTLLAEFFEIDLQKVEREKRAILAALREGKS